MNADRKHRAPAHVLTFRPSLPPSLPPFSFQVSLIYPTVLSEGLRFAVREGGRTVAAGVVAKLTK
jgi:hypothetical protein